MLVEWIILAVVVATLVGGVALRRRSHDDVHSVEGYHRQLHTLEVMRTHPPGTADEGAGEGGTMVGYPERAFRVGAPATVRLTEPGKPIVPPVAPPPQVDPDKPITFEDAGLVVTTPTPSEAPRSSWRADRTMDAINHRPRRLGAPAAAVAVVAVLIVVLLVTGSHHVPPKHHHSTSAADHARTRARTRARVHHPATTTTTAAASVVSLPTATSTHDATYTVGLSSYSLVLSATSSECWVDATNTTTGASLYAGTLTPGEAHTLNVTGPVTVISGAPDSFTATVNGTPVVLPFGFQAPFNLHFVAASGSA